MKIFFDNGHVTIANVKTKTAGLALHKTLKALIKQGKDFTFTFKDIEPSTEEAYQEYLATN